MLGVGQGKFPLGEHEKEWQSLLLPLLWGLKASWDVRWEGKVYQVHFFPLRCGVQWRKTGYQGVDLHWAHGLELKQLTVSLNMGLCPLGSLQIKARLVTPEKYAPCF